MGWQNTQWLTSLLVSAAIAIAPMPAFSAEAGPLAAGGAAGVKQAQAEAYNSTLWIVGAGGLVGLAAALAMNNSGNAVASMTVTMGSNAAGGNSSGGNTSNPSGASGEGPRGGGGSSFGSSFDTSASLFIVSNPISIVTT